MQQSQLPRLAPLKAHWGPPVQWFPAFQGQPMVQHLFHAGCPCAFPMGEHMQDSGSCSLFNVSDLQLFPGTKRFMLMSSIIMLLWSPREVDQSQCIALTAWLDQQGSSKSTASFFHSFYTFLLQVSATCDPKQKEMESSFYSHTPQQKAFVQTLSLSSYK